MPLVLGRFPLEYRSEVVTELMTVVQQGDSACLVGLAGAGKSNLARFLEVPEVVRHYLPASEAERTHFRRIDCSPDIGSDQIYEHMAQQVRGVMNQLGHRTGPTAGAEESEFFKLRHLLKHICEERQQRMVFIFDEFESLVRNQEAQFLQHLRTLRDDHRTTRNVVYLVITHRLPHLIARQPAINKRSKFFELLREHLYALPPYQEADANSMIDALVQRRGDDPAQVSGDRRGLLCHLSGGHSGLLAALFDDLYPSFAKSIPKILQSANRTCAARSACEHIWHHLHADERAALNSLVHGQTVSADMLGFLHKRGLVHYESDPVIFSPLFAEYIRHQTQES